MKELFMVNISNIQLDEFTYNSLLNFMSEEKRKRIERFRRYEDKFLRIKVLSHEGDKVNVQLPIKVIKEVLKVTGKLPISTSVKGMEGVDIDELMNTIVACLDNEVMGEIVDVCSNEGDSVKVVIE